MLVVVSSAARSAGDEVASEEFTGADGTAIGPDGQEPSRADARSDAEHPFPTIQGVGVPGRQLV